MRIIIVMISNLAGLITGTEESCLYGTALPIVPTGEINENMSTEILIKISILVGVLITIMLFTGEYYS